MGLRCCAMALSLSVASRFPQSPLGAMTSIRWVVMTRALYTCFRAFALNALAFSLCLVRVVGILSPVVMVVFQSLSWWAQMFRTAVRWLSTGENTGSPMP